MPSGNDAFIDSGSELSEEEDELRDDDPPEYALKGVLRTPRMSTYSIEKLYAMMHCGDLDLEPEYQRGFVWTEKKQIAIIDSLLRNYYIPPVIFHVKLDSSGEEKRVAIDGKQRLTSIQRFIDGLIPHKEVTTGASYWSAKAADLYPGKRLNILPAGLEKKFYMKQIMCVEYEDLTDTQEREIFHRVQLGMPLTPAERMSAVSSHRSQTVHVLEKILDSWPETAKLADDRKRRFTLLGHFVQAVSFLDSLSPKIPGPTALSLEKWLRESGKVDNIENLKEDVEVLIRVAKEHTNIAFSPSIALQLAPVEFIFSALMVHRYRRELTLEQLASAIRDMRHFTRREHADIRTNTKVSKTLAQFILEEMPARLDKGVYGYSVPASAKRKRDAGNESEDDYVEDTAAMDISGDERKRCARKKRTIDATPVRTAGRPAINTNLKSSPAPSTSLFSPLQTDSNTSRSASSNVGNPPTNLSLKRSSLPASRAGVGPFGRY